MRIGLIALSAAVLAVATTAASANNTVSKRFLKLGTVPPAAATAQVPLLPRAIGPVDLPAVDTTLPRHPAGSLGASGSSQMPSSLTTVELPDAGPAPSVERPTAFGKKRHPFTTKNAFLSNGGFAVGTTQYFPYAPTGKLWTRYGSSWFVCTASMIDIGIAVTAAHCVHRYGKRISGWPDQVLFEPARFFGSAPFGSFEAEYVRIPAVYYTGKDACSVKGVVCENDVAVVTFYTDGVSYPGSLTGFYGFGWNGFSTTKFLKRVAAQITQLGFPVSLNGGYGMIRSDSLGYNAAPNNVIIGSDQSGGSSGGPWLVNFGSSPSRSGNPAPRQGNDNVVVATTSWGYTDGKQEVMGASRFGNNSKFKKAGRSNIQALYNDACAVSSAACTR